MPRPSKREQVVEAASKLFARDGFHATGVDRIVEEAGVARMTLYKHFKTKDDLILAVLRQREAQFLTWFKDEVEARAGSPGERLLASFDVLGEWFAGRAFPDRGFTGCLFINASAEYSDLSDPVHRLAAEHKRLLMDFLRELARAAGARDPEALAKALQLLQEGAIVMAHVSGDLASAKTAKAVARRLLAEEGLIDP